MTVIPIRQGLEPAPSSGEVDEEVVAELEELLGKAKAGEITGLVYVCLHPGDLTSFYRVGRLTRGIIGTIEVLKHAMCQDAIED